MCENNQNNNKEEASAMGNNRKGISERDYSNLVNEIKADLSQDIIAQSTAPINRTVTLITVIFSLIAAASLFFSFTVADNLKSSMQSFIEAKVESWLSFNNEDSFAQTQLEDYRTRALLDSFMIKLARNKAGSSPTIDMSLKTADTRRLLAIIKDPGSTTYDFLDAATLLRASRGYFPNMNDHVAKQLRDIFRSSDVSNKRKLSLLQTMNDERALIPVAESFLTMQDSPQSLKMASFILLTNTHFSTRDNEKILSFAKNNLTHSEEIHVLEKSAAYIARDKPLGTDIKEYIKRINQLKSSDALSLKVSLISNLAEHLPSNFTSMIDRENGKSVSSTFLPDLRLLIANLMVDLIEESTYLRVVSDFNNKLLTLSFNSKTSYDTSNITLGNLPRILNDKPIMDQIFTKAKAREVDLRKVFYFFNTEDKGYPVVSVGLDLSKEYPMHLIDSKKALTSGTAWVDNRAKTGNELVIEVIDAQGEKSRYPIEKVSFPNNFNVRVNYNEHYARVIRSESIYSFL